MTDCAQPRPNGTAARAGLVALLGRGLLWLSATAVLAVPFFSPGSPVSLVDVAFEQPAALTITGSVAGLTLGTVGTLELTVHSDGEAAVVQALTARVTGSPAGCPASALTIGSWTGRLAVPAHGSATAQLPITLRSNAAGCAGATWQLGYTSS